MHLRSLRKLAEALSRFVRKAKRAQKRRALASIEKRLEKAMQKAFRKQGGAFMRRFWKLRDQWTVESGSTWLKPSVPLWEGLIDADWWPMFDEAAAETWGLFEGPLAVAVKEALRAGAQQLIDDMAAKLGIGFDLENPRAVAYLREHGAEMVTKINETTREVIKDIVTRGTEEGWSYDRVAKEITTRFQEFAIGKPQAHIRSRAHLVAITEAGNAYEAGNYIVAQSLQDAGIEMDKLWVTMGDSRVSSGCLENAADDWIPIGQAHTSGDQHPLRFPGCLPGSQRIVADGVLGATKRFYDGSLVVICTANGNQLTCTPNHPVLTPEGWVSAGLLDKGTDVVCSILSDPATGSPDVYDEHGPVRIEEVAAAFGGSCQMPAKVVKVSAPDFHGDGEGSKVAVVWSNGLLGSGDDPSGGEHRGKKGFVWASIGQGLLYCLRHLAAFFRGALAAPCGIVSGPRIPGVLLRCSPRHHEGIGFGNASQSDARFEQPLAHDAAVDAIGPTNGDGRLAGVVQLQNVAHRQVNAHGVGLGKVAAAHNAGIPQSLRDSGLTDSKFGSKLWLALAGQVFTDQVTNINRQSFRGHVYNLQTENGFYVAGGIITHNCRCDEYYQRKGL